MEEEVKGKARGGKARASKLSAEERANIAQKAAKARWRTVQNSETDKIMLKTDYFNDLKIGNATFKAAVLEDKTRVLTRATFVKAMGRTGKVKGGRAYDDEFKVPVFLTANNLKPFIPDELWENSSPVFFKHKSQQYIGYKAALLPQVCGVFIDAYEAGVLNKSQEKIAQECKILLRGFATVGIIALIDEATGYQYDRDRDELSRILEAYISPELMPWTKRFPPDFYKEIFRLHGWEYNPRTVKRPGYVGKLTNALIYEKLPYGVLDELKRRNPKDEKGRRKFQHHRLLTIDIGNPHLEKQLVAVTTLLKVAHNWKSFKRNFDKAFPISEQEQVEMDFLENIDNEEVG